MSLLLVQGRDVIQLVQGAIHARPHKAGAPDGVDHVLVLPLAAAYQRREQHDFRLRRLRKQLLHDLLGALPAHGLSTLRAVRVADVAVEQAQVVVDFRGGGNNGARVAAGIALLDGNGRRKPLNVVHIRLLHLIQELPGIGRKTFNIATLPLGIQRVKSQRRLAGAAEAGDNRQAVARNAYVHILEVVLARAGDDDVVRHGESRGWR